jgi:topoisomerase-4 subunit A
MPGPDFPTGGIVVEPHASILEAYKTGRGSFRLRAKWETEKAGHGTYQIVVTEIPYQIHKGRLIEKIAELIAAKKLPLLADVRDESTDDIRLVLEPKSRTVEAAVLMEHMFRHTDLEIRIGLNMNVLDASGRPTVLDLRQTLQAFLDHRHEVLERRTRHRLEKIAHRLEILEGYLIAYLNLDEVIRIIREEDEPKQVMMKKFKITDAQAEAILNMRLRALRKLEEIAIRDEHKKLSDEQKDLKGLLASDERRRKAIEAEIKEVKAAVGPDSDLGRRRTTFAEAPAAREVPLESMIEREPITIICSEKGWIRAVRGHVEPGTGENLYKKGDRGRYWLYGETTDKLIMFATNGRFYTIGCDKLPRGRGHGEPVRLMAGMGSDQDVVALFVHDPTRKLLVASTDGRGFVVPEDQLVAQTRNGKQVLNVSGDVEARVCSPVDGDSVAVIGENRKLLIFPLDELPEMNRGRGVTLQRYKDGGLSDVITFHRSEGLSWRIGERLRTETDLMPWEGKRGNAGRLPPKGFPKSNRFF